MKFFWYVQWHLYTQYFITWYISCFVFVVTVGLLEGGYIRYFYRVVLEIAVINDRRDFAVWLCDKKHFGNSEGKVDLNTYRKKYFLYFIQTTVIC